MTGAMGRLISGSCRALCPVGWAHGWARSWSWHCPCGALPRWKC